MAMFNSYIKLPDGHTWLFPKTGVPPVLTNCATEEKKNGNAWDRLKEIENFDPQLTILL